MISNIVYCSIKFCKCYVIKRFLSNFLNKTQLKIKIKIKFFLTRSDPTRTKLELQLNSTNTILLSNLLQNFQIKRNQKKKIQKYKRGKAPQSLWITGKVGPKNSTPTTFFFFACWWWWHQAFNICKWLKETRLWYLFSCFF